MLYKKYHRNFVRKFKVGVRFNCYITFTQLSVYTVVHNPYYSTSSHCIEFLSNICNTEWNLVYPGGKINKYINVV